jgi:hypothetical protein
VVLCLTATLDSHNQNEVIADFRLSSEDVIRSPNMLRTNFDLSFRVFENGDKKLEALESLLAEHHGREADRLHASEAEQEERNPSSSEPFPRLGP